MEIRFFNTMERRVLPFNTIEPGKVGMYTCGPTVYNFAHIGNFRAYMFEDILRRTLEYFGYQVKHVMNLTDVDDKTIRDSKAAGVPLDTFTRKYKDAFFHDIDTLNIERATIYPEATKHISQMQKLIQILLDKGYAYQSADKCIYFSIDKFRDYGKLAHIDRENQRAGVRIKTDEYEKDSVADFALWKAWDENDGDVWWESPWGRGRPGWHIECSAMATEYLGKSFDLHTGGIDNMFPHHEDEIAQSEAANGQKWVNTWMHCAHLMVNGEKMSKSLGNFFTLRDLLAKGYTGREIRLVLISAHYRKKLNFTFDALAQSRETLKKFEEFFRRVKAAPGQTDDESLEKILADAKAHFDSAMADDLNVSEAMAPLFEVMRSVNKLLDENKLSAAGGEKVLALFKTFDRILGCLNVDEAFKEEAFPSQAVELAEARAAARKSKNFAESDRLRDELKKLGFAVEDVPGGTWRLKKL